MKKLENIPKTGLCSSLLLCHLMFEMAKKNSDALQAFSALPSHKVNGEMSTRMPCSLCCMRGGRSSIWPGAT